MAVNAGATELTSSKTTTNKDNERPPSEKRRKKNAVPDKEEMAFMLEEDEGVTPDNLLKKYRKLQRDARFFQEQKKQLLNEDVMITMREYDEKLKDISRNQKRIRDFLLIPRDQSSEEEELDPAPKHRISSGYSVAKDGWP